MGMTDGALTLNEALAAALDAIDTSQGAAGACVGRVKLAPHVLRVDFSERHSALLELAQASGDFDVRLERLAIGDYFVGAGVLVAGRELRWRADSMHIGSGAQVQAANSVSLIPYRLGTAIRLGEASDGTPGVLALDGAELSAINAQNLNIGFGQHNGTLSIDGMLDLAASNAGNAMLTLSSNAIAVSGSSTSPTDGR